MASKFLLSQKYSILRGSSSRLSSRLLSAAFNSPQSKLSASSILPTLRSYSATKPTNAQSQAPGIGNLPYIEQMYEAYLKDPESVHVSWRSYFQNLDKGLPSAEAYTAPPNELISGTAINPSIDSAQTLLGGQNEFAPSPSLSSADGVHGSVIDHLKVQLLVRAYEVRGHHLANLDPLGITSNIERPGLSAKELELEYYGFTEADMGKMFKLGPGILPYYEKTGASELSLKDIFAQLKKIYCGSLGVEYTHIVEREKCDWFRKRLEVPDRVVFSKEEKARILDRTIWSTLFEQFSAKKFPSQKRFGLEGAESLIPGLKELIDHSVDLGIENIEIGMSHRGRLNVLSNVVRKPNESIFCEFSGDIGPSQEGSGDARYHLGMNFVRPTPNGKRVNLSLLANPSHLEATDAVVLGKTRAVQTQSRDADRKRSMALLMHGDAAFAAQGIVYETLGFSALPGYTTGGTIHVIINNQVGFTTDPRFARSTTYPSDIAKAIGAPVLHVNADDVENVVFAFRLASEWRQTFGNDVVIDLVGYRRHGHNETDQPAFTQPLMYQKIQSKKNSLDIYSKALIAEGTFTKEEIDQNIQSVMDNLESSYIKSKTYTLHSSDWDQSVWPGFKSLAELSVLNTPTYNTGISREMYSSLIVPITSYPSDFNIHKLLSKIYAQRKESLVSGRGIDWATAEALAAASLLMEGNGFRLSGQDVERGTFSQRHWVLHDQKIDKRTYTPLEHVSPNQGDFSVTNSSLSEYGVVGYELGYSLANPNYLVIWEAQFGDFSNGAQIMFDQYIAAGEKKWLQRTGFTLSLPHGFDGQGSEHSSARLERCLQLCDENPYVFPTAEKSARRHQDANMQVVNISTPANYFHALRRQIHRDFRKPLIMMSPKKLLRFPLAKSNIEEMLEDTRFATYLHDPTPVGPTEGIFSLVEPSEITTHILCSGQVYYSLLMARELNNLRHIAISRVEELHPFPWLKVRDGIDKYPNCKDVVWTQEEPMNMGAWSYVEPRLRTCFANSKVHTDASNPLNLRYSGRLPSGPVASANPTVYNLEQWAFISAALYGEAKKPIDVINDVPKWE
ncbi:hypothetical protein BB560_005946 [Smittium megazygosporum]|uniref:2-oxoglutarate dehydrogenase, mitochondrial n=1 Tax=Smittium megazygosporum TaxID=133381 RepID=A0A2T9YPS4_9FUNG|nr:hypothetical protein BB560_005946 [Smittium megazygosporum]